jgi:cytochrome c oxidase cbb3-type subunit 2
MPAFPWLFDNELTGQRHRNKMKTLRKLGVPYTDEDIAGAQEAVAGAPEGDVDALVAYLQQLGTLIQTRR